MDQSVRVTGSGNRVVAHSRMTDQVGSKPAVGRIVHYVSHGSPIREDGTQAYTSECRAAIITEAPGKFAQDLAVSLCVLNPTGQFFSRNVTWNGGDRYAPSEAMCDGIAHDGGTWHWPARV